jgi:fatty-acyl-CoA synthase
MATLPGIGSWIERRARIAPDQIALVHGTTRRSYAELAARVDRLAAGLRELGVVHGDRVGWLGESHPAFLETLFAAAKLGAVFAPVNHRLRTDAAAAILDHHAVKVAIVEDAAATIELPASVHVVHVRGETSAGRFEALISGARATRADARVVPDDVCIMPHTSGTTGSPKGVMLTHANVTWNAVNMITVADLRSDDVTLALAPLFRTGGMGVSVLPLLFKGGTVVLPVATTPTRCSTRSSASASRSDSATPTCSTPSPSAHAGRPRISPASASSSPVGHRCPNGSSERMVTEV